MFSDFLESPSTGSFSFNDQSSSCDMAEMNEISNQTNFDYIFDSYYSSVSQFNTGFELPEDCKNMSFSELFDQELFSTHDNKDCKITIKIEEQEPLKPCYSADDSQDITDSHSFVNIEECVSTSSSLSKNFVPKRGINRTSIKTTENYDVKHLIYNPFSETDLGINQILEKAKPSVVKSEPEDTNDSFVKNIVGMEVKSSHSDDNTQSIGSHSMAKDNISSSLLKKSSTSKRQGINRTSIKTSKCGDVHPPMFNPFGETEDLGVDQVSVEVVTSIVKREPEDNSDTIEQNSNNIEQNVVRMDVKSCYFDDSESTFDSYSLVNIENNVSSSLFNNSSTPKRRGINRTSIKTTKNWDAQHPMFDPFCITEDNGIAQQKSIVKREPEDICDTVEQNIIMEVKPCYSANDSQSIFDTHSLVNIEDNVSSSLLKKSSAPKYQCINRTSLKTTNHRDQHTNINPFCETKDLGIDQISVKVKKSVLKREPDNISTTVERNIVEMGVKSSYSADDSQNTYDSHSSVEIEDVTSLLPKSVDPKCRGINKNTKNCDVQHLGIKKIPGVGKQIVIRKPEDINNTFKQNIVGMEVKPCYSVDSRNPVDSHSLEKIDDIVSSSLSKSYPPKRKGVKKTFTKTARICDVQPLFPSFCKTEDLGIDQISVNIVSPLIKREPEDIHKIVEKNIVGMEVKPCYSAVDSQNTVDNHSLVKIEDNISSSSIKSFGLKCQGINKTFTKTTENCDLQHPTYTTFSKTENLGIDQMPVNILTPLVKREPEDTLDIIEQNIVEMEVTVDEEWTKYVDPNDFKCVQLNNKNINGLEVINKKKVDLDLLPNVTFLENNHVDFQTRAIKNEISLETEKKKISWEEYRARGKMDLFKSIEIIDEPAIDLTGTDNGKLKAIIEEFDRNTVEHFIGQKRKIEDKEEIDTNVTVTNGISTEEDQELEKKRMKIEYIKKLLPSSFASEIAKTSSLMKGSLVEDTENESVPDDSVMSNNKTQGKFTDTYYDDLGYPKKEDKFQKKSLQTRVYSSHRNTLRSDYGNKSRSSSTSSSSDDYYNRNRIDANPDNHYNRNRIDATQQCGQYGQNIRNLIPRPKDKKRVVYVGQIPIRLGKRYLHNRFKQFGTIQSLTLHKKPDFRVYYAFVTYSEYSEAEYAINHGNDDESQVELDIRFGERKQTLTPYYDLDDEWLTDWYQFNNQPLAEVRTQSTTEKVSFEEELQEFYKLAQIKKLNQIKSSPVS